MNGKPARSPRYSTGELVVSITKVCSGAGINSPLRVTQREFDAGRSTAGVECPRASDLSDRFGMPWRELVEKAHRPDAYQVLRLSEVGHQPIRASRNTCISAVKLAARRLDQETLLPREYAEERERAMAGTRGPALKRLECRWPVLSQIQKFGWEEILKEAGLSSAMRNPSRRIDEVDLMELFLECRGYAPTMTAAVRFARRHGIAAAENFQNTGSVTETVFAELSRRRTNQGKWTPPRPLIDRWAPDPTAGTMVIETTKVQAAQREHPARKRNHWTEERILKGLDLAVTKLDSGDSLTQVNLRRLARTYPGQIPSVNTADKYAKRVGSNLRELREQAIARVSRRQET